MTSLTIETLELPIIQNVEVTDTTLSVDLSDGRSIAVPLAWYPRLLYGSTAERNDWRLIGGGEGIHWNELDEDISIKNLILGQPSGESQKSLQRWLNNRASAERASAEL
ncbi:MAG: DUF2442 domain-containing protein [Leptolyngbyaceae cyanobacterium SM1_3_5]|nr:DUF2442 domain-containing protein [Leptolyngbyaceae cyanobacterium SM1_3_5]